MTIEDVREKLREVEEWLIDNGYEEQAEMIDEVYSSLC